MKYEKPEMQVLSFAQEDILTASGVGEELLTEMVNNRQGVDLGAEDVSLLH